MYPVNNVARTLESVERSLSRMTVNNGSESRGYLACRYAPFESKSHGVPDGMGTHLTTRDFYNAFDIVSDGKGFDAMILPYVPTCAMITPSTVGGTVEVQGQTFKRPPNWNSDQTTPVWAPLSGSQMGAMTGAPDKAKFTVEQNIATGRVVTVGYRLYYTGPAATCEGTITAVSLPVKMDLLETNFRKLTFALWDGGFADIAENSVKCASLDMQTHSNVLAPDAVIVRPEHGLHGVLKRRVAARSHHFKPWWEEGAVMLYDKYGSATAPGQGDMGSITAFIGGQDEPWTSGEYLRQFIPVVSLVDDDFEAVHIKIRTGSASRYRLEIMTCVQFEHTVGFPLISLTQKAIPPVEAVLKKDDALNVVVKPGAPMGSVPLDMANVALPMRVRRAKQQPTAKPNNTNAAANNGGKSKSNQGSRRRRARRRRAARVTVRV